MHAIRDWSSAKHVNAFLFRVRLEASWSCFERGSRAMPTNVVDADADADADADVDVDANADGFYGMARTGS